MGFLFGEGEQAKKTGPNPSQKMRFSANTSWTELKLGAPGLFHFTFFLTSFQVLNTAVLMRWKQDADATAERNAGQVI